jgi:hypothetical protein
MKILAWVAVPIVVTMLAWLVNRIANRPKAPLTPEQSMQAHERFLQVLETPVPTPERSRWAAQIARPRPPSQKQSTRR